MSTTINLRLTPNESRLVQLALGLLISDRKRATQYAEQIAPECRAEFLRQMDADQHDARELSHRIDAALNIRRRFTTADTTHVEISPADEIQLLDTPTAEGLDTTDCTGVLKGNTDIVCERVPPIDEDLP